jgi:nicotinate-nucleotide--dimethylbenzimidazole phosphoribosyltransferase
VQGQPAQEQSANDLSSDRLRSVAPVPAPRAATPEPPAQPPAAQQPTAEQPAPRPTRSGSFGALLEEPEPNAGADDDADEMIVPWSAADQARAVAEAAAEAAGPEATQQAAPVQQESAAAQVSAPVQAAQTETPHPVQAQAPVQAQPSAQQAPSPSQAQAPFHDQAQVPAQSVTPGQVPAAAAVAANAPTPRGTRRRVAEPAAVASAGRGAVVAAAGTQASSGRAPVAAASRSAAPRPATGVRRTASASASVEPQVRSYQQPAAGPSAPALAAAAGSSAVRAASAAAAPDGRLRAPAYEDDALAAVYRVIHERRDVRNDFLSDEVPTETLTRILDAAHTAPSVGFSQPWDFLVIRDEAMRQSVHDLAARQRRAYAASLPKARARAFAAIKTEAILDTPVNIVVTCDPTRGGRYTLGRHTQPLMAPFSSCLAVENLWLAARAEGLGVGWVSFFDERELAAVLDLPDHLQVVAYLCVGYVASFPQEPELAGAGWAKRRPLAWAVHEERFGHRALPGAEPISLLNETVDAIRGLDPDAVGAARDRQARMTKPPGSLGALEAVSEQLAGLAGTCPPPLPEPAALAVFAGDHGVHAQGVTPWPQEVTAQMVANFLAGGAVVNAFAKQVGAEVCVVDVGVNADLKTQSGLIPRKVRYGTADMTEGPALTREEVVLAVEAGIETARDLVAAGNRCLLTGDMGIANTTASAALIAAFTGASPAQVTGYGTGIDEQTYAHKVEVVGRALALHQPDPQDPIGVLAAFGGLEHAALAGFILGASALRIPVVLDGVIAGAAALVAQALSPEVTAACVAGHRSAEPGHALALEALGITPLIDLELRLGEGSGAALALPLVGAAVRALREVATFDDAGVADASDAVVVPPTERERT